MNNIYKKPISRLGYDFISPQYIPEGKDEFYLRDEQHDYQLEYRKLTAHEIEVLVKNENTADDWTSIYVTDHFNPNLVKGCQFYGKVRIGALGNFFLEYHDLQLPVGLYNSTIVSCDIGNNVVINNVNYLALYQIGNEVILVNINEMGTTDHAKFGNGTLKDGEGEDVRIWLEVANENGGRRVLPFDGMLPGDAFIWSKYRNETELMDRLVEITNNQFDSRRGYYGSVGDRSIIKNTLILKDVKIGSDAYIKGGNKLKNLTINSSPLAPTQIGEGVELVNGIIGYGCRIFYGVKAVRFIMGFSSVLKYGARLINSYLGDNSTISCCEVLNSLIAPGHEQHHNNSFLCAATIMGQTNMAAGATIGSNHNSRANDGEIVCGRGFWPGLCVSLKHNSKFASFMLIAKGAYPAELDIPYPFTLINNNEKEGRLEIIPGFWMLYNMYALARNSRKIIKRDKRIVKQQLLEYDFLAPDTVEEMFTAMISMEKLVGEAFLKENPNGEEIKADAELIKLGRAQLRKDPKTPLKFKVSSIELFEASRRESVVLKPKEGYHIYREMIRLYAVETLVNFMIKYQIDGLEGLVTRLKDSKRKDWVNVGGQLIPAKDLKQIRKDITSGKINSWDEVHEEYKMLGVKYPDQKAEHAFASLLHVEEISFRELKLDLWSRLLKEAVESKKKIARLTFSSRKKDYDNPFRKMVYDNQEEMEAVIGKLDDNEFVQDMKDEAKLFAQLVEQVAGFDSVSL